MSKLWLLRIPQRRGDGGGAIALKKQKQRLAKNRKVPVSATDYSPAYVLTTAAPLTHAVVRQPSASAVGHESTCTETFMP